MLQLGQIRCVGPESCAAIFGCFQIRYDAKQSVSRGTKRLERRRAGRVERRGRPLRSPGKHFHIWPGMVRLDVKEEMFQDDGEELLCSALS